MKGYFAINTLTKEPRWKHESIYLFAIDTYGYTLFSGDPYSQWSGVSELKGTVEEHDLVSVAEAFGESFLLLHEAQSGECNGGAQGDFR